MKRASIVGLCSRFHVMAPLAVVVVASLLAASATADEPLAPKARYRGDSLANWSVLNNEWAIASDLGGGTSLPDTVNGVRLLPFKFDGGEETFEIDIAPGTALSLTPWFAFGERYDNGEEDDPVALADLLDDIFESRTVTVLLDDEQVLSGTVAGLGEQGFTYGPTYFAEPIEYDPPRGAAVAAIWTVGVGALFHPLTPGEHTIYVVTVGPVFGETKITYNITVSD